jgi:hypothetical protein
MSVVEFMIMLGISLHWGFATGGILAIRTNWTIPHFIVICLMMRYFLLSYGI